MVHLLFLASLLVGSCSAFSSSFAPMRLQYCKPSKIPSPPVLKAKIDGSEEEYVNPITKVMGKFISKEKNIPIIDSIDWSKPKRTFSSLDELAVLLEKALIEREWFVTGNVDPSFFSEEFSFQDPDVKIKGIKEYAAGVNKIFSQADSRAEVIRVQVNNTIPSTITVTWRLSGAVNLGPGLKIKPYLVYTDLTVSPSDGLIIFQEDRFSIPGYDILLSALFPFLAWIGLLAPPAPSADELRKSLSDQRIS